MRRIQLSNSEIDRILADPNIKAVHQMGKICHKAKEAKSSKEIVGLFDQLQKSLPAGLHDSHFASRAYSSAINQLNQAKQQIEKREQPTATKTQKAVNGLTQSRIIFDYEFPGLRTFIVL